MYSCKVIKALLQRAINSIALPIRLQYNKNKISSEKIKKNVQI